MDVGQSGKYSYVHRNTKLILVSSKNNTPKSNLRYSNELKFIKDDARHINNLDLNSLIYVRA